MIDGSDLRAWLGERKRPWRAIVEVFIAAGAGLAAAHDAGIIHRDFKPDNVLMARNGRVLVGDFGIAAASPGAPMLRRDERTHSWLGEAGTLTVPGALLGTPAYMAPEQMAGGEITPAADVFAFCVALFEAIEGQRPFRGDTLANLYVAIQGESPRPLTAKVPRRLARALRRGLEADPRSRHASMHALLAELRPLVGSRRGLWLGGAALVVVTAAASTGLWAASAPAVQCTGGEVEVAGVWTPERRAAIEAAFMATKVAHAANTWRLVTGHVEASNTAWSAAHLDACEATHVRGEQSAEVLDRRMLCLDRQLGELDRLLGFLGEADPKVVEHAVGLVLDLPAATKCDASVVLAAAPPRDQSPELTTLEQTITYSRRLHRVGKYKQALEQLAPVIDRLTELGETALLARALAARAQTGYVDSHPEARAWIAAALEAAMRAGDDLRFAEVAANQLGLVGADAAARELWLHLGEAALQRHGGDDSVRAKLLTNYGNALRSEGRLRDAEAAHREALALRRREDEAPHLIADALFNLGAVLASDERVEEAIPLMHEAIGIWTRELGPQHPRMLTALSNLAVLAKIEADYAGAHAYAEQLLALTRSVRGELHPDFAYNLAVLGAIENWQGDFIAAKDHFDRALALLESPSTSAMRPERRVGLLLTAASFRIDAGDLVGADELLLRARAVKDAPPSDSLYWIGEATARAQLALIRGDLGTVERELQRGTAIAAKTEKVDGLSALYLALHQAELDFRRGRHAEALARVEPLLGKHPREFKHPYNRGVLAFLSARILWAMGRKADARASADAALAAYAGLGPGFDRHEAEVRTWIAGHEP
jgi:tetratricopeptide (TPR) repeat protein